MARRSGNALEEVIEPDSNGVRRRLAELGIPPEALKESIRIGHTAGDFVTAAHPPTYQGTVVWGETTGAARVRLAALGWKLDNTDNIPRAVSPDGVTVVAVRGNEHTGLRNKGEQLSTRRPRGEASVRVIRVNTQIELQLHIGGRSRADELLATLGGTWFLLYNRVGDVVRNELSFARAVGNSGKLLGWAERLILDDVDLREQAEVEPGDHVPPPDVDVPVTRRAG